MIRPRVPSGEQLGVIAAFATLFGMTAAHTLLETARDSLFLATLPASQLPWAYLAIAAAAAAISRLPAPSRGSRPRRHALAMLLAGTAVVTAGFWIVRAAANPWTLQALYVWTGVNATLTGLYFWYAVGDRWTVTDAKRIYKWIAIGGLLGGVAGGAFARELASAGDPESLVLASAVTQALTGLAPAVLLSGGAGPARQRPRLPVRSSAALLRGQPYVRGLAWIALLSTVALTASDFVFKSSVAREVPPSELGWFFGTFYAVLNVLALLTQLLATGWLLRVLGLPRAQHVLPFLLAFAFLGVAAGGGVLAALVLKLVDGSLRETHRTTSELLLVPVPDAVRSWSKPFLDIVVRRGGQALASVAILAVMPLPRAETWLAAGAAAACLAWITRALALRQPYLDLFRTALREHRLPHAADLPPLDLASLEALFAALGSNDDGEVLAAMDVLAEQGRGRLIPSIVLYHPSQQVVLRALAIFERSGRADFAPAAAHLLGHSEPAVRAAALQARTTLVPEDREPLRAATRDASPIVRSTALVGLVGLGELYPAAGLLQDLLRRSDSESRLALARAISRRPSPNLEDAISSLAASDDPPILVEVARAIGRLRAPRFLPVLLDLLRLHQVRPAAREAFVAFGDVGLAFLQEALADPVLRHEVRRHVPRTISRFPPERAARILLARLVEEQDGMVRFRILRGLGRIVVDHPSVSLDRNLLRTATTRTLEAAFRLLHWRVVLELGAQAEPRRATAVHGLLAALLRDKERHAVERIFRLIALRLRGENLQDVHRGLRNADPRLRASSRELLEHLLRPPLRGPVLALVDEAPAPERIAQGGRFYRPSPLDYEGLLATLLDAPGDTLRTLAVHHAGELGLVTLRGKIERLGRESPTVFLERAAARAAAELSRSGEEVARGR